jgi:predicted  nucleic acid-binding Zn-ribbon protein
LKGQLDQLIRLQEIDSQLGLAGNQKAKHPLQLEEARRPLLTAEKELEKARSAMESASKTKRDKEQDLQAQESNIEKLKSRQTEIKTNKEYHALLQELESAKEVKGRLEEELLLLMEKLDFEGGKVKTEEESVKRLEAEFKKREAELAEESSRSDQAIAKLEVERSEVAKHLDENLLANYSRLKNRKKDLAVVPVIGGTCGGCHMNIPPQLIAEVKLETQIHTCSYCQRILYFRNAAESKPAPSPSNSLQ